MAFTLPDIPEVKAKAKAAPAPAQSPMEGLLNPKVAGAASSVQTEFGKQFARSFAEAQLSDAFGFPVHIPDEEEVAYAKAAKASRLKQILQQDDIDRTNIAITNFINLDDAVKKANGLTVMSVVNEPEKFIQFVNTNKLTEGALTAGALFSAGVGSPAFAQQLMQFDPEARAAMAEAQNAEAQTKAYSEALTLQSKERSAKLDEVQQPIKVAEARGKQALLAEEYAAGEGVYGPGKEKAIKGAEKAFGADITSSLLGPDTEIDEPHGAAALLSAYNAEQKRVGGDLGSTAPVATAFNQQFGADMADQLEELPLDGGGNIVVGQGVLGVDKGATLTLAATAMRMAKDLGKTSVQELFQEWGIKAAGVDPISFVDTLMLESAAAGGDGFRQAAMRLQEYGLIEEFGPTLLARMTQAAGSK